MPGKSRSSSPPMMRRNSAMPSDSSGSPYTLPPADMQCGELPLFKDSDEPSGMAGARPRPHAGAAVHQRSFKELGFAPSDSSVKARSSSAIQKTRAKKAPAPESRSSGVPDNWMPSFLPLGMMAAALSKDLAEQTAC